MLGGANSIYRIEWIKIAPSREDLLVECAATRPRAPDVEAALQHRGIPVSEIVNAGGAVQFSAWTVDTAFCRIMNAVMAQELHTTARLEARLPAEVHALLKRAAEIEGRTLTDFVVSAAREAACRTIEESEIIRLSIEDQRQIAEALLNPPEPAAALKKAFRRRRELFGLE